MSLIIPSKVLTDKFKLQDLKDDLTALQNDIDSVGGSIPQDLAAVATTGSYNDLTDKPDLTLKADKTAITYLENFQTLSAVSNIYTLDISQVSNFAIETTDTNAKTITFSNTPATANLTISISVKLKYTNAASITHPTGTAWKDATIPAFTAGKQYLLLYVSYDNGTTWLASSVGAW